MRDTFDTWRDMARRRGVRLPDLSRQGTAVVPRRSVGKGSAAPAIQVPGLVLIDAPSNVDKHKSPARGRPTGIDGRALPRANRMNSFGALVGKEIRQRDWTEQMAYGWVMGNLSLIHI